MSRPNIMLGDSECLRFNNAIMRINPFKRRLLLGGLLFIALAASIFLPSGEYQRLSSPDGRFYAIARYPLWQSFVPVMPGGGGDMSGSITIYSREGNSCGRAPVDMVSLIGDVRWSADEARIPAVAEWDLLRHRVNVLQ